MRLRERASEMRMGGRDESVMRERGNGGLYTEYSKRGVRETNGGEAHWNGGRKGVDSRTNKTLAASFLPVWPDTDPLYTYIIRGSARRCSTA